jgi:anti-sigma regulatory factor (Ser/Thr protein kinase)
MRPDDTTAGPMVRKRFRRHPRQVAQARAFVAGALAGGSELQETARLLVSETVTSALAQSPAGQQGGTFEVGYALVADRLHVEVSDDGGPARLRRRIHRVPGVGGRGLQLVQALARRWGVREGPTGRTIWFELDPWAD